MILGSLKAIQLAEEQISSKVSLDNFDLIGHTLDGRPIYDFSKVIEDDGTDVLEQVARMGQSTAKLLPPREEDEPHHLLVLDLDKWFFYRCTEVITPLPIERQTECRVGGKSLYMRPYFEEFLAALATDQQLMAQCKLVLCMNSDRLSFTNYIYHLLYGKRKLKKSGLANGVIQFICDEKYYADGELDLSRVFASQGTRAVAISDNGFEAFDGEMQAHIPHVGKCITPYTDCDVREPDLKNHMVEMLSLLGTLRKRLI